MSSKGKKAPNKGIKHTEETRRKISQATKGRKAWNKGIPGPPMSEEKKAVFNFIGRKHTEESKRKMSENSKGKGRGKRIDREKKIIDV
jgi:hypothetical protein